MDNINEVREDRPKQERIIALNQEFHPFDPHEVTKFNYKGSTINGKDLSLIDGFASDILLTIEDDLKIPIRISADLTVSPAVDSNVVLDHQELGYHIDSGDLSVKTRREKIKQLRKEMGQLDYTKVPLSLVAEGTENLRGLSKEALGILKRLRMIVYFPDSRYEGKPLENPYGLLSPIRFNDFYPLDTGPLPSEVGLMSDSFSIHMPSDINQLQKIKTRFVLVEEQLEK